MVQNATQCTRSETFISWGNSLPTPIMWSGGCNTDGSGSGWITYCTNVEDFDNATSYLSVDPGGVITVQIAGYYRIDLRAYGMSNGWWEIQMLKNESSFYHGLQWLNNFATDNFATNVWYFATNDTLKIQVKSADVFAPAYEAKPKSQLQIQYLGPLPIL